MLRTVLFFVESLLCHPLMAHGAEVDTVIAWTPGFHKGGKRDGDADAQGEPDSIHERPLTPVYAIRAGPTVPD